METLRQRGGGEIGAFEGTWPFATITVSPGSLTVSLMAKSVTLTCEEVTVVEPIGFIPIIGVGVQIHHTNKGCPQAVAFYSFNRSALLDALTAAGFRIGKPPSPWGKPGKLG
jgi:hypothetical protein